MYNFMITSVGGIITQLLSDVPFKHKMVAAIMRCVWKETMPAVVCSRTEGLFIKGDKVFLKVNSAPLRQELQANKKKILQLLTEGIHDYEINDIIFL